ncbi:MAG: OmpH family outer membrane protein [Alphaproteobacteria bacterium]|nr:MAG: OmpH family outer membrane protein [Alphaproteobacteria bacterium]
MNKLLLAPVVAGLALTAAVAAQAQQLPAAVVAVVNRNQVAQTCTPCAAATGQLQAQGQAFQSRQAQLAGPLQAEQQAIQTAINALPANGQPDAALTARIRAFETNRDAASAELGRTQQTLQRNENYVVQQILQRMQPMIQQVAQQRGATVVLDTTDVLTSSPQVDLTPAVLALMNANATPFNVTAPAPAAAPAAATPAPAQQRPRPPGR